MVVLLESGSQWLKQTISRHVFGNQMIWKYWLIYGGKKVLVKMAHFKGPVIIYSQGGSGGNEGGDLKNFSLGKGGASNYFSLIEGGL